MRHVLVIDAGKVSQKKGRAYWSKSVAIEDAPVFTGVTGGNFIKALHKWLESRAVQTFTIAGKERRLVRGRNFRFSHKGGDRAPN